MSVTLLIVLSLSACHFPNLTGLGWNESERDKDILDIDSLTDRTPAESVVFYTEAEPYQGHPSTDGMLYEHADTISTVIGFWWQIDRNDVGRIAPFGTTTEDAIKETIELAKSNGMRVEALFHNLLYGRTEWSIQTAVNLLTDEQAQKRLVAEIARQSENLGLSGVNVDIENVPPAYRHQMTRFVELISEGLHRVGVEVSISVPSKTWDDPSNGWSGAFDYEKIGQAVDRVILMTYDEHGFVSGPGPIASSGWVERVVQYAVTAIDPSKVFVGIAGYGFDWGPSGSPQYISYRQAVEKAQNLGIKPQWDGMRNSPHYSYIDTGGSVRHVWYEDASSNSWKLDLVDKYHLGGFALWRGGLEDPDLWRIVAQKFDVLKK